MQSLHRFFSFLDSWNSYFPIGAYIEQTPTGMIEPELTLALV